ncbi:hypothetical protein BDZ94DRAFT_1268953 [Collybia nuda]|uniref:Uncharacterized protein n=1 Tax=Collybia nuda TaxID=64659 RepID=A0A9P6CB57_9AGAR|nr:hypothetical protein BDZ94DRAFT_1268953 [Collybia nuda]
MSAERWNSIRFLISKTTPRTTLPDPNAITEYPFPVSTHHCSGMRGCIHHTCTTKKKRQ